MRPFPYHTLGNAALLELPKVAFLCSRRCPEAAAPAILAWARAQAQAGTCVVSGFHSEMEQRVLGILLADAVPVILGLARGIPPAPAAELVEPLAAGRLLLVTQYAASVTHPCRDKCRQRNRMLVQVADRVVVGYAARGGELEQLCRLVTAGKPVQFLDLEKRGR